MQEFLSQKSVNEAKLEFFELLSGLVLTVFLVLHMFFVSFALLGTGAFDWLSNFMESFYLTHMVFMFVVLCIVVHILLVFRKVRLGLSDDMLLVRHLLFLKHKDSILWFVQVISGFVLMFLISIHMWSVFVDIPIRFNKVCLRVSFLKWFLFDGLLSFFAGVHAGLGIYRMGIKWGFVKKRKKALFVLLIFLLIYFFIEFLNLWKFRV